MNTRSWRRLICAGGLGLLAWACGAEREVGSDGEEDTAAARISDGFVSMDDGVRLFYRSVGNGAQAVVIPQGLYLEESLLPLRAEDRRLVFYDPRGRGRSDAGDRSRVTLDRQIADLEALRRELGIDSMAIIGWSGMGMETAVYAMRHPERVTRLVQVAPVAPRNRPHNLAAYEARARRVDTEALDSVRARAAEGAFDSPADACRAMAEVTRPANFADTVNMASAPDVCVYPNEMPDSLAPLFQALLGSFGDYDWRDSLGSIDSPRLVIHGAADAFPVEGSREWVAGRPNGRLLVLEEAGHFPFLERADAFFPAVDTFLRGDWPAEAEAVPPA